VEVHVSCSTRRRIAAAAWPSLVVVALAACGPNYKSLYEEAIAKADRFVATAQTNGGKILPEAAKSLSDSLAVAKSLAAAGNYRDANNKAVDVANAAILMAKSVGPRRTEMEQSYNAISNTIGPAVRLVVDKAKKTRASGRPPKDMTAASFDSLTKEIAQWEARWKEAADAHAAGEIAVAANKAESLKNQVLSAMAMLGVKQ
jgi:hypothetical protein